MKLVIDIYEKEYERALNRELMYPRDLTSLEKIIANGKPLPNNPTNGDMIKAIFPKYYQTVLWYLGSTKWWNSPYKEEDEDGR